MTETHATPTYPPGRYGRRREPRRARRWPVLVVAALVALAALAVSVRLFQQYGQPAYEPRVLRFYDITDDGITVEFEVRKPADQAATCRVRARSANSEEVGLAEVDVPADGRGAVKYRLATSTRPVTVEVPGCGPLRTR